MDDNKHITADPLPYIIIFAFLFFIVLGMLTWVLDLIFKQHSCSIYPNIWCSDNWTCNDSCPTGSNFNSCFNNIGPTGLASCIFGPDSIQGTLCLTVPSVTGGTATSCNCTTGMSQQTNNCLAGCPQTIGGINPNTLCCCKPGSPGCPNEQIPIGCLSTT